MASTEERLIHLEGTVETHSRDFSAVRDDIRHLEHRLDVRMSAFEQRMNYVEQRFDARFDKVEDRLSRLTTILVGTLVTMIGGFLGIIGSLLAR